MNTLSLEIGLLPALANAEQDAVGDEGKASSDQQCSSHCHKAMNHLIEPSCRTKCTMNGIQLFLESNGSLDFCGRNTVTNLSEKLSNSSVYMF